VIGSAVKELKAKKADGLIATLPMGKADTNPAEERRVRKEKDILHAGQPPVLVRKKAKENLGGRKEKSHELNNRRIKKYYPRRT
jgi:hypothetical protein